jgi:hypothetical protein
MKHLNLLGRVCCLALVVGAPATATTAYEFSSAPATTDSTQLSLGFTFITYDDVLVTNLGYYDDGGDGFSTQHEVGIFGSTGALVADSLLSAGTIDPLTGHFRYVSITPVLLPAGQTFTIAATTHGGADPFIYGLGGSSIVGLNVDPAISIPTGGARFNYQADNTLRDPENASGYTLYGGPDFLFESSVSTPEPQTLTLVLVGLGALFILTRRRLG